MNSGTTDTAVDVCSVDELRVQGLKVASIPGHTVAIFWSDGGPYAVDNRCPHMGFPMSRGTVSEGILTCHWHHAKFELAGGCTFDPFADDLPVFPTEVRDGRVWVDPHPKQHEDRVAHWRSKLVQGLEQNLPLVLAKSVIGLSEAGEQRTILSETARFGVRNRAQGWSAGLSILTCSANVLPHLPESDRARALYHGAFHVARDTAERPPDFDLDPLTTDEHNPEVFRRWFRRFIETRSADAAERSLRTAIANGLTSPEIAGLLFSAATDHLFMDEGHALDFANKACELTDHIGWEHAAEILPSLIQPLVWAQRMEETSTWRHPVDLPAVLRDATPVFHAALDQGGGRLSDWDGHRELAEIILDAEPRESIEAIVARARDGVPLTELSAAVAYAAALRPVHFHVSNEFGDWDTVHHSFTYTNAVDQALRRSPSPELARGVLDGAMSVYLERFLNVPKQRLPLPNGRGSAEALLSEFDRQQRVDETAQIVVDLLDGGGHEEVIRLLGHALLREDAGFHMFQIYEAALRQYGNFTGRPEGDHILIGAARFLTAHSPTVRARGQTFDIAARLNRGEALHADA
ncbi:MAG TPA: Rieske (2Fe-2S) protein [Dehalococcoidia bacterium]|nr:Rieske (2Fe-2S) protein [Dehalococcoidia bacterium]